MATITLSIPDETRKEMKKEDAEEIAQAIKERVWKMHKGKMGTL